VGKKRKFDLGKVLTKAVALGNKHRSKEQQDRENSREGNHALGGWLRHRRGENTEKREEPTDNGSRGGKMQPEDR